MNTIVGFACAVGTDMDFNREQYKEQKTVPSGGHTHKNNQPHDHAKHEHDKSAINHHASKSSKDNCCKEEVAKLTKADKLIQPGFDYSLLSLSFFILAPTVYRTGNLGTFPVNVPKARFVWHYHPPIPDVRIAIQSFQI
ncbi:MAG: hypothetical protein ACO1NU_13985 [Arcticibacter sp.]